LTQKPNTSCCKERFLSLAKAAGMTRSGFLAAAASAFETHQHIRN